MRFPKSAPVNTHPIIKRKNIPNHVKEISPSYHPHNNLKGMTPQNLLKLHMKYKYKSWHIS